MGGYAQVDVDDSEDVAMELGVTSMPTVILFFEEREVQRFTGANGDRVRKYISAFLEQVRWIA
jgi:thioredoxin-like negative regulator of GroEL